MTIILAYILFIGTMLVSLFRPWVGVVAYYLIAIWVPFGLYPWVFKGERISLFIGLGVILGFIGAAITNRIDFRALKNRQNLYIIILWLCLLTSYYFSPYGTDTTWGTTQNPNYLITAMSKVFCFYFISILAIDNMQKCTFMVWVMLFSAVYLIYWGNMEYFEGRMRGLHWTLMGPGYEYLMTAYVDENTFAMFFVMAIPFLYFMGSYYKNRALRYLFWVAIPFAWHCIFLTGSRGGLLGLFVVTLYMIFRSKSRILSVVIPAALVLAFIYQSGAIMKGRVEKAIDVEQDSSAQNRMNSWEAGIKMMIDHPITGIGIGNFVKAYPHYSNTKPFVAHNTIIQLSAESGVGAGLMYLLICSGIFMTFFKQKKLEAFNIDPFISALNDSITGSLAGFFVCALFLNLANYEIFYYLLILHSVRTRLISNDLKNISSNKIKPGMTQ